MGVLAFVLGSALLVWALPSHAERSLAQQSPSDVVVNHVEKHYHEALRDPKGVLKHPYIVPAGPYDQLWDWDSVFTGIGLMKFGVADHLAGSVLNFLDCTDDTGYVPGVLFPDDGGCRTGAPVIPHAKPVLLQGAWLASEHLGNHSMFYDRRDKMVSLLDYWEKHRMTPQGLFVWADQMESGADDLPLSDGPFMTPSFNLTAPDVNTFMYREYLSLGNFFAVWSEDPAHKDQRDELLSQSSRYHKRASEVRDTMNNFLFNKTLGRPVGASVNLTTDYFEPLTPRVYLMGVPLFANLTTEVQASSIVDNLLQSDMWSPFGVRSTSSNDPHYNNEKRIVPASNWQGPVWIIANAFILYGLQEFGYRDKVTELMNNVLSILAKDIEATGGWHECYHSETGEGLAAPNFLSWNVLAASFEENIAAGVNPLHIAEYEPKTQQESTETITARHHERVEIVVGDGTGDVPVGSLEAPSSSKSTIRAFLFQNYTRSSMEEDGEEVLTPVGGRSWLIRFLAEQIGTYKLIVRVGDSTSHSFTVTVLPSTPSSSKKNSGRVKVGPNRRHFVLESGDGPDAQEQWYFPTGTNLCWADIPDAPTHSYFYDYMMPPLADAGANFLRVWLGPSLNSTFLVQQSMTLQPAFGQIDMEAAWRVDHVLSLAETLGYKVMLVIESFNSLCEIPNSPCSWDTSVYNAKNGGPVKHWWQWWSDATSKAAFKDYLSYVVSRYGAYDSVFAWQLFNEVETDTLEVIPSSYGWHSEMADFVKAQDSHRRLLSESFGLSPGNPLIDGMPQFDFTTTHNYRSKDVAIALSNYGKLKTTLYDKPTFVGEYGDANFGGGPTFTRSSFHNGMFAPLASMNAGPAIPWYWNYMLDFIGEFRAVSSFTSYLSSTLHGPSFSWSNLPSAKTCWLQSFFRSCASAAPRPLSTTAMVGKNDKAATGDVQVAVLAYFHDTRDTWQSKEPVTDVAAFELDMSLLKNDKLEWEAGWFNTTSGNEDLSAPTSQLAVTSNKIPIPSINGDGMLVVLGRRK